MSRKDIELEEELEITAVTAGTAPIRLPSKITSIFPALVHRNYQLYFAGQAVSLIGFWLQAVGIGFLVFQLTHSAFWVGTTAAIGGLPFLVFTSFAGVFIDKMNKKKLLVWTQVAEAFSAILLGVLVVSGNINLPLVLALAAFHGTVGSIDLPARFAFIVEMVGKRDLASAISLNVGEFNAARFIGPTIAGIVIASFGVGWAFILNGLSFIAGIWAIAAIKPVFNHKPEMDVHPFDSLKEGFKFTVGTKKILYFTILAALSAIFIWPYQTLMPPVAEKVFNSGAKGLGSLLSAAGAGSLAGAIFTSAMSRRKNKNAFIFAGLLISSVSLLLFALNKNFFLAHVLLAFAGFGTIMLASTLNTQVQLATPDKMRARVLALYLTMFVGMMPVGNTIAGTIAQKTSSQFAIGTGSVVVLFVGLFLYLRGAFSNLT